MSFNSLVEHIKQFHDGQEVLLEIADQLDDIPTVPATNTLHSESGNVANTRQRQSMNTLRTEECVDSEGRLYTRKVVQIERFWDKTPAQTSLQSTKAPMIEKFFSNVEGVKVYQAPISFYTIINLDVFFSCILIIGTRKKISYNTNENVQM